jgi:hypothetical protein
MIARNGLTRRLQNDPKEMTRYRPMNESERKAPKMDNPLDIADHKKRMVDPLAASMR